MENPRGSKLSTFSERKNSDEPAHQFGESIGSTKEPIAIIGVGCNFPGAKGPKAFWHLIRNGGDAITEIPLDRFDINLYHNPKRGVPGKIVTRRGGFLENVDQFDPYFFGISPREASSMDPQQRLLLEVTWEALEDAGVVPKSLSGSSTGIFIGMCASDYGDLQLLRGDPADLDVYSVSGSARSILSGRLSYFLDLHGPSVALDTACSSSLVAVHLACQSIWAGECTLALAGGVNLILNPAAFLCFSTAGMLAPDGLCKFGDARADGFVRSEGAGVVVLKPLSSALVDGDPIYALIRGSAANNDGRSSGMMMPSLEAQKAVLRMAYRNAAVSPSLIQYVEAHGTGTLVGDPIEIQALGSVLGEGRPVDRPCVIGSVKTNIGHLEGGAGIAGLIKVALALKHREIPPSLHLEEPNPYIQWEELPLVIQQELGPWPGDSGPALAGVSSFGISGVNLHVVLEEAPLSPTAQEVKPAAAGKAHLLPLSAHTPESLLEMVREYQNFVTNEEGIASSLQDVCYTASVRRTHHDHRLALVAHSHEELEEHLGAFLNNEARPGMFSGIRSLGREPKLAFVFSGQGPRWWPLDKDLMEQEIAFREVLENCDEILKQYTTEWSLLDQLTAEDSRSRMNETEIAQPALFAIQAALLALWRSLGIEPEAVIGHSIGEVAAAYAAGILNVEDGLRLSYHRGRLIKQVVGKGKMALVGLNLKQAQEALSGYEDRLSIAANNGPASTVLSGDPTALEQLLATLELQKVFCRMLPAVDFAAHSPDMDPLKIEFEQVLEGLQPRPASVPIYSTVTGKTTEGLMFGANYWARNLREPVLFSTALDQMLEDGYDIFLEVHPHTVLMQSIQEGLRHAGREGTVLSSLKRGEDGRANLLGSLGALYVGGYPVDWNRLFPSGGRHIQLPSYPWKRERYWVDIPDFDNGRLQRRTHARQSRYLLLGQQLKSALHGGTNFWESNVGIDLFPYLADHRVQGLIVLPAAAYLELVLAAAAETFGPGPHTLEKISFKKALVLKEDSIREVQLVLTPEMPGKVSFQVFSSDAEDAEQQEAWTLHATGTIHINQTVQDTSPDGHATPEEIRSRCPDLITGVEHYQTMAERGLQYGPEFQGVEQIWRRDGEAIGRLNLPEKVASELGSYKVHPALLDSCFQVLEASIPRAAIENGTTGDTFLPVGLRSLRVYDNPDSGVWSFASLRLDTSNSDMLEGDVLLLDEAGTVLLEAQGISIQRLGLETGRGLAEDPDDWLYEIKWQPKARPDEPQSEEKLLPSTPGSWLIFADSSGLGKTLAAWLNERGQRCILVTPGQSYRRTYKRANREYFEIDVTQPQDMQKLLGAVIGQDHPVLRGVIHLWGLGISTTEENKIELLERAQTLGPISILHLIQALARVNKIPSPHLWLITRGSQAVGNEGKPISISQSPLWGLGKVIFYEHPELSCKMIDLDPSIAKQEVDSLLKELWLDDNEDQIALRGNERYVARLVRYLPESIEEKSIEVPGDHPYRLEASPPGILDHLKLRSTRRQEPGPGQVEIQVYAAGLNFLDVLSALGMRPDQHEGSVLLGMECAGRIAALGEGVEGLQVGAEVLAIAPSSFSRYVITAAPFVLPKSANMTFEEAATIPVAFMTAHYALDYLARLGKGERVLIHAAAGGVGLAAVRLAQRVGAEIFATAGSSEKQEFLRSQGIEHIMSSRSLDFSAEVVERTGGEGVDVILNSLAGEFIPKSLSVLRANGRFLEIGKRDIYQNSQIGMGYLRKNISFHAIDLVPMFIERREFCAALLQELVGFFEDGSLKILPFKVFSISEAENAFRYMAQANHIGKIVLSMQEETVHVAPSPEELMLFRSDSTYLITGGLGGLGLSVAQWMVDQGVRHLALMGRSRPSTEAQDAVDRMEKAGAEVMVVTGDVSQEGQVANALSEIRRSMPPLRGVIHAAGVLDDGILLHLNEERFKKVLAPKMNGAWHLHNLTLNDPLDHFILFSSVASVLGSPGQGNYVAANAFLDGLAHYRHTLGLPALAINWGAWSEVGLAARADRAKHVTQQGMVPFTPAQGVRMMERVLQYFPVQVTGLAVDWTKLPSAFSIPLLSALAEEVAQRTGSIQSKQRKVGLFREKLLAAAPEERQELMETFLKEQIARVLRSSPSNINLHQPLDSLGIDSLMGFELINRLEAEMEVSIPIAVLLQGSSPAELTRHLLDQMKMEATPPSPSDQETEDQLQAKVEHLSDAEVDALLNEMLEDEEETAMISRDTNE